MTVKEYATKRRINEADVESIASLYNVFIHNGNISDEDITKLDNSFHLHRNNLNNMIFDMKSAEISYINGVVKEYEDVLNFATDDNVKVYAQKYIERFQKIKEQRVGRLEMTSTLINHNISSYANISDEANPLTNEITRSKVRNLEQQLEAIIGPQGTLVAEERKKSELEKVLEGAKHFKKIRQMQLDTSKKKIEKLRYSATTIKSRQTSLINKNLSAYYARVNNKFKKLEEKASRDLRAVERYNRVVKKVNYADTQLSEIIGDSLIEKAKRRYFKTVKFCEQNKLDFIVGWNELLKRDLQAVPVPQVKPIITTPQFSPVIQTSPAIQTQSVNTQEKEKREALLAQIQKVGLLNQTQNTQDNKHQAMIDQINASKEKASQITRAKTNYETVIDELIKSDSVIQDRISAI